MRRVLIALAFAVVGVTAVLNATLGATRSHAAPPKPATGIHKIKHVIVIMQENRSFDHYFGTYPGADGLPRNADGTNDPICSQRSTNPDVIGSHDGRDIPNYWAYARNFVLQDHMFEPNASWSLPAHLFMVSE